MKTVKEHCKYCGGSGYTEEELKIGSVVTPKDGSCMPWGLHSALFTGKGFKPVRILAIEGDLIAVIPACWSNEEKEAAYSSLSSIYLNGERYGELSEKGCWVSASVTLGC